MCNYLPNEMSLFLTVCNILVSTVLLTAPLLPQLRFIAKIMIFLSCHCHGNQRSRDFNYLKDNWILQMQSFYIDFISIGWISLKNTIFTLGNVISMLRLPWKPIRWWGGQLPIDPPPPPSCLRVTLFPWCLLGLNGRTPVRMLSEEWNLLA